MSEIAGLVDLLFPFFGTVALGALVARLAKFAPAHLVAMQVFLIYLALPALFFRLIASQPLSELANGRFVLVTTGATALSFALAYVASRAGGLTRPERVMGAVAGSYANVGYMGPPLVVSLLGSAASAPVALIFVFDTIFLFAAVPGLMATAGMERHSPWILARQVLFRIALHPFMIATAVAVAASLARWHPPAAIGTVIGWLSGASAPCALFLLGATVSAQRVGTIGRDVSALVSIKLLAHPALAWLGLRLIGGIDPVWIRAAIVMAALPPALNIFVLASQYRVGIERASACVLVGTLASVLTLSAVILLVEFDLLPLTPFR